MNAYRNQQHIIGRARAEQVDRVNDQQTEIDRLRQELAQTRHLLRQAERANVMLQAENARLNEENDQLNHARLNARRGVSPLPAGGEGMGVGFAGDGVVGTRQAVSAGAGVLSQTEAAYHLSRMAGREIKQYQVHRWMRAGCFQTVRVPGKAALHVLADSLHIPPPAKAGRKPKSAASSTKQRS